MDLGGPEIFIVLAVILLVFGGSKLPGLARNLGEAVKELKAGFADEPARSADAGPPTAGSSAPATPTADATPAARDQQPPAAA